MDKPEQPPEGRLIAEALRRSKLSARKASELAGMSDGRWGQIVRGYQTMGSGVFAPVRGPAETVAKMAQVVGVTPAQLEDVGRADAAEELRELLGGQAEDIPDLPESADELRAFAERLLAQGRTLEEQGKTLEALGNRILGVQGTETTETERKTS
jgi:transcriptional regulator with XRE-family HTH domain